ncbi:MAG: UDP-N-acetylmuramate dehydrogenase [Candidatus Paceibacterota bacterium]
MKIFKNYDLTKLNTFGIKAKADFFIEIKNEEDFLELLKTSEFKDNQKLFLGGGSNVLFTKDFNGIVILNRLKGIEILKENEENVWIKSMGGELWNDLVLFSIERGYWGMENLSLIPGTVGATPVQNIGAYGVEVKDIIEKVEAYEINTGEKRIFTNLECEFGYRDSIFKNKLKGQYFITAVVFKLRRSCRSLDLALGLNKKPARNALGIPASNASRSDAGSAYAGGENKNAIYKALQDYLEKNKIEARSPKDISDAVTSIRKSKLPDPKMIGNAGSFFKNVYVNKEKLNELIKDYLNMPYFQEGELVKIPSGWLIEQCGPADGISWKGNRIGNVGVYEKQALVIVNYGGATGKEILNLVNEIITSVYKKFGLKLIPEVNLI